MFIFFYFSRKGREQATKTKTLASKISLTNRSRLQTILTLMMPQKPKALGGPLIETKAYLIILIRQLKRKFDRQLKI